MRDRDDGTGWRSKVDDAGQALLDAVYRYWSTLRAGHRPRLLMFGESLGTLGGEAALPTLQHASDPITWWSPMLAVRRPDWLHEARGPDVLPAMRWYPFVTFWQVIADLVLAQDTRLGHGHRYGGELASAWVAIAPPPGWTSADTARPVRLIETRG